MLVSFLQKTRLGATEAVIRSAEQRATQDRESAHQTRFALDILKTTSCLESGREPEEAEGRTAVQLARALTPEQSDRVAMLLKAHADDLRKREKFFAHLACWIVAAAYEAHSMSPFEKVADRANRLMTLVDQVEAKIIALSDGSA